MVVQRSHRDHRSGSCAIRSDRPRHAGFAHVYFQPRRPLLVSRASGGIQRHAARLHPAHCLTEKNSNEARLRRNRLTAMGNYLLQRLAGTIPVLLLISLMVFLLIHAAPGAPTLMLLGEETNAADIAKAKERWGLDQPIYVQYLKFLKSAATGDFGKSFKYAEPVIHVIKTRLPATI